MKKRKAKGEYKSSFAAVTHYFGYQGRCACPSQFDCSLGTSLGYGAGCLIEQGFTGHAVAVRNITCHPSEWRIGGVPILALVDSVTKLGYHYKQLVVPAFEVDLKGPVYETFKAKQRHWENLDHYSNPGPIQFYEDD
jgi:pyrophosphate--fructose-6-phosphate 1-phosphotransferase